MKPLEQENATLRERIARLEAQLAEKSSQANPNPTPSGNHTRFDTLFETMELGVVYQDAEGAITQANPAAERILGMTLDQMQGRKSVDPRWRSIHEDGSDFPGEQHPASQALRTGLPVNGVVMGVYHPTEKDYHWLLVSAVPEFQPAENRPFRVYTTFSDINERKHSQDALTKSEERYRSLFENMLDGMAYCQMLFDHGQPQDFIYLAVNRVFEMLTGLKDVVGKKVTEVIPGIRETDPELFAMYARVALSGNPEVFEMHVEALKMWFSVSVYSPQKEYFVAVFDAITERKQSEERIRVQAARLKVLADASETFVRTGKNYHTLLESLVHQVVEALADMCQVRLVSGDGEYLELAAIYSRDPEYSTSLTTGKIDRLASVSNDDPKLAPHVFRSGEPAFVPVVDVTQLQNSMPADRWQRYKRFVAHSYIIVPLRVQQRSIGVLSLTRYRSEQPSFSEDDLSLALDLANRAALAIESAHLFEQVQTELAERRRAEAALRERKEELEKLLDMLPMAIWIADDPECLDIRGNRYASQMLGVLPDDNISQGSPAAAVRLRQFSQGRELSVDELPMQLASRTGQAQLDFELRIERPDQITRTLLGGAVPIFEENGKTRGAVSAFLDITDRKNVEEELLRSNAELEQFAYVASHDLQEPLRAVAGMVTLLEQRYRGKLDERADEYIGHAVEASLRMQNLINDLLDYSRVGRFSRPFEPTPLESCLNAALINLQAALQESQTQVTYGPLPTVTVDPGQMNRVFQNLIGNALKFRGEAPPRIHISAEKVGETWRIAVSDNGIGIEPQYFERIFLVFQRLHTRREYAGTGIGLSVCKKIIERHGGRIWVESQAGQGSTFYFSLPERKS